MSAQFGRWNIEGKEFAPDYIRKLRESLAPYGPDSDEVYANSNVTILYRAFHTTPEAAREVQPYVSASGIVVTWDGRLDNRAHLIRSLGHVASSSNSNEHLTDVELCAAAIDRWGEESLGKLIGDWALSVWDPRRHSLLLAKDPIGTRHLYYAFDQSHVTW